MTDNLDSPRLAALRSLEASLLAHRQAEEATVTPPRARAPRSGSRFALRLPSLRAFWSRRGARRTVIALAALTAVIAIAVTALGYRLSSGPITLDFATDWLAAAIKEN